MGENELIYHIPGIVIVTQCNEIGIFKICQNFFRWAYRFYLQPSRLYWLNFIAEPG